MPELLRYAKSKNVGVWLWTHWTSVQRQMEPAFALYEKWGVAGVKIDNMNRDDQWMVDFTSRMAQNRCRASSNGGFSRRLQARRHQPHLA